MATILYTTNINGVPTNVTSVSMCDAAGAYGVKRNDTGDFVVAANTPFTNPSTGTYSFTFDAILGVQYTAWIKRTYGSKTLYRELVWVASGVSEHVEENETTSVLRYTTNLGGVPANVTSVVLCDPTGIYGIKRNDTGVVAVAANTAFDNPYAGVYTYNFSATIGVQYTAWIKRTYNNKSLYREIIWTAQAGTENVPESEITPAETLAIIAENGTDALFYMDTPTFDPTTSETTRSGSETHIVKVVEESRAYRVPNSADVLLYFSPSGLSFTPAVKQLVDYKGQSWTVVSALPAAYKGEIVLWTVGLKGTC